MAIVLDGFGQLSLDRFHLQTDASLKIPDWLREEPTTVKVPSSTSVQRTATSKKPGGTDFFSNLFAQASDLLKSYWTTKYTPKPLLPGTTPPPRISQPTPLQRALPYIVLGGVGLITFMIIYRAKKRRRV